MFSERNSRSRVRSRTVFVVVAFCCHGIRPLLLRWHIRVCRSKVK